MFLLLTLQVLGKEIVMDEKKNLNNCKMKKKFCE